MKRKDLTTKDARVVTRTIAKALGCEKKFYGDPPAYYSETRDRTLQLESALRGVITIHVADHTE